MNMGDKIRTRREELGISQAELAKRIGVTQGSIGNYESGVSKPKMELMPRIFQALQTDANYLFGETAPNADITYSESQAIKKYRTLDQYGKETVDAVLDVEYRRCTEIRKQETASIEIRLSRLAASAGTGEHLDDEEYESILVKRTPESERADFAVMVNGDSMEGTYSDGDILLVESTPRINSGDIGIFTVNSDGYVKEFGGDRLISHNPNYDDILLHDYDVVLCSGRVIGIAELA